MKRIFSIVIFMLFAMIPVAHAESYGPYEFTSLGGGTRVTLTATTSSIANTGEATFTYDGESKTRDMDNGDAPLNGNSSGEATFSDGTKVKLDNGKVKYRKKGWTPGVWRKMSQVKKTLEGPLNL